MDGIYIGILRVELAVIRWQFFCGRWDYRFVLTLILDEMWDCSFILLDRYIAV